MTSTRPPRRPGRIAGYGGTGRPQPRASSRPQPRQAGSSVAAELFAWLATTAVAGALLALLARHDWLLALPVILVYVLFCWLLWQIHQRTRKDTKKGRA